MKVYWVISVDMARSSQLRIADAVRGRLYQTLENYFRFLLSNADVGDEEYLWAGEGGFALLDSENHDPKRAVGIAENFLRNVHLFLNTDQWGLQHPILPKFRVTIGEAKAEPAARLSNVAGWMLSLLLKYERTFGREDYLSILDEVYRQLPEESRGPFVERRQKVKGMVVWDARPQMLGGQDLVRTYLQRGDTVATSLYGDLIGRAQKRIWAFGMSNGSFFSHHAEGLVALVATRDIDVKIAFWDPRATLTVPGQADPIRLLDVQHRLEGKAAIGQRWEADIKERFEGLLAKLAALPSRTGKLVIYYLSLPTNFTALVVDDDLFFFPFLAPLTSAQQPTLRALATAPLGTAIVNHLSAVLQSPFAQKQHTLLPAP